MADQPDQEEGFLVPPALVAGYLVLSQELIDENQDLGHLIEMALRGEIRLSSVPVDSPIRHRCFFCWLVSLLPGHDLCPHGRLEQPCPCNYSED